MSPSNARARERLEIDGDDERVNPFIINRARVSDDENSLHRPDSLLCHSNAWPFDPPSAVVLLALPAGPGGASGRDTIDST